MEGDEVVAAPLPKGEALVVSPTNADDYVITDAESLMPGGGKRRQQGNLAAIRLVAELRRNPRAITPDEQDILVHYGGAGDPAMSRIIGHQFEPLVRNVTMTWYADGYKSAQRELDVQYLEAKGEALKAYLSSLVGRQIDGAFWRTETQKYVPLIEGNNPAVGPKGQDVSAEYEALRDPQQGISKQDWATMAESTATAHFTDPEIAGAMWAGVRRLGAGEIEHIDMLEPTAGNGLFLGTQPEDLRIKSSRTAVEMDRASGTILRALYPNASVHVSPLQDTPLKPDSQEVSMTNVPFSRDSAKFPMWAVGDKTWLNKLALHNQIIWRMMELTRPGGVFVAITTHGTLDAPGSAGYRQRLRDKAELIAAYRLPNTAHMRFAQTEVVTDVIFFRKRLPGEVASPSESPWINATSLRTRDLPADAPSLDLNEYYVKHPENVLGTHSAGGTMYAANEYTLQPRTPGDTGIAALQEAVKKLPKGVLNPLKGIKTLDEPEVEVLSTKRKVAVGRLVLDKRGNLAEVGEKGVLKKVDLPAIEQDRAIALLKLGQLVRKLVHAERNVLDDEMVEAIRADLNRAYQNDLWNYGNVRGDKSSAILKRVADQALLKALEDATVTRDARGKEKTTFERAVIFSKRIVRPYNPTTHTDKALDALYITLAKKGTVDIPEIAALTGKSSGAVIEELGDAIFRDPSDERGGYVLASAYLSGNVKAKLAVAEQAVEKDPSLRRNVKALRKVIPLDVSHINITAQLGAAWVPAEHIAAWLSEEGGGATVPSGHG